MLLILALFIGSCGNENTSEQGILTGAKVVQEDTIHVVGMVLQRGNFQKDLISQAKVEAISKSDVVFTLDGTITNVYIQPGQRVKEGQLLATLDDFRLRHEVNVIRQELEEKVLSLQARLVSLGFETTDSIAIPSDLYKNLKIEIGIPTLRLREKMALYQLEQAKIKAPIGGVIADVIAQVGNPTTNYTKLCTIIGDEEMQIGFPVLEGELLSVKLGRNVDVFPFHNPSKSKYSGRISAINPQVNKDGMITVFAKLNSSQGLLDGMQVRVHLHEELSKQIAVPKRAIVDRQDRHVSFVLRHGVADWVYCKIVDENATQYALDNSGPKPGDTIIVENNFDLSHLQAVILDSLIQ